jgi:hypothetical protein
MNQVNIQQFLEDSFVVDTKNVRKAFEDQQKDPFLDAKKINSSNSFAERRSKLVKQITSLSKA